MNKKTSILVVDDDPAILQLYSEILRAEGYEVWEASTGQEGLQAAHDRRPDLVLLDVMLPDLSGMEVCRQIKADAALKDVFVVLASGAATSTDYKVDGLGMGADDYLVKPLDIDEFLARVRTIVRLRNTTAALRASEHRHRRLVEILPEAVILIDPQGRFLTANPQAAEMLGYADSGELLEKSVFDLIQANDHERIRANLRTTLATGTLRNVEYLLRKKGGDPFPAEVSAAVAADADGQPSAIVLVARDTTERKQAEEALQAQTRYLASFAQFLQTLMDAIPVPIFYKDVEGRYLGCNKAFEQHLGLSREQIIGKGVDDVATKDLAEVYHQADRELMGGAGVQAYEGSVVYHDGTRHQVVFNKATIQNMEGELAGLVGVIFDVTERKRVEEQLRMLSRAVEQSPAAVIITDPHGNIEHVNAKFTQVSGYSLDEVRGQNPRILKSGEMPPEEYARLWQTITSGREWHGEFHNRRKNGELFWEAASISPILDEKGRITHFVAVKEDITEQKCVESMLRHQRDFGIFLSSTDDLEAAAQRLLRIALENEGLDCGAVYLVNSQTNTLELTAHHGLSNEFALRSARFAANPAGDGSAGARSAASREQVRSMAGIVHQLKREGLLALEVIPIQHAGQVVAVLNIGSRVQGALPAKTFEAVQALASQAGGAIARIRAEQAMRASQQLLRKTIHGLHAAVFVVDAHTTTIEDCNPAATRLFGYSREQMIGQCTSLLHLDVARWEEFRRHLQAAVKERGSLSELELTLKRKDGTTFAIEQNVVPIRSEKGEIETWVAVIWDLTERKRIEADLRQLSGRIIEAQEIERKRVARDLHDSVNQVIASAKMRLRKIGECARLNPVDRERLARCEDLLLQALEENRRIAHDLRPADLDALGLAEACRNFCRQFQARTNLVVKTRFTRLAQRCAQATELNLFRIVQETLNNIEKHADARTVRLQIAVQRDGLRLRIQDDGRGFDPNAVEPARRKRGGIGLKNIRERAEILGGTCEVVSAPNQGTAITVRVPFEDHRTTGPKDH